MIMLSCDPVPWDIARSREIGDRERRKRWRIFVRHEIFFLSPSDLAASPTRCRARRTRPKAARSPRASAPDPSGDFLPRGGAERPPTAGRGAADARAFSTPRAAWQRRPLAASRAAEGRRTARASAPPRPTLAGPPADFQAPYVGWDQARSGWDPPFLAARSVAASSASATLARPEAAAVRQSAAADPRSRARRVAPPGVASA